MACPHFENALLYLLSPWLEYPAPVSGTGIVVHRAGRETVMLYMVIEHFRNRDAVPVYRRFRDEGRLAPHGLHYVSRWVDTELARCFQVMECESRALLDRGSPAGMTSWISK